MKTWLGWMMALICMVALWGSARIAAQTVGTGAIQGTIEDTDGNVIAGASVTALDVRTGHSVTQKTAAGGNYRLDALAPSIYTITVSATGFRSVVQKNLEVDAMTVAALDLRLKVGTVQTMVDVSTVPPQLNTSNGTLEMTLPNEAYTNLPTEMSNSPKSPLGFLSLIPGTQPGLFLGENLNGGPGQTSFFYINGMPIASSTLQGDERDIQTQTSTEVVDQFQVLTSGIPAYYEGNGVTNLIMKSGTNRFHGDIYENIRNTVFDAAGYFAAKTPVERQNEFGATLGGPILKNRIFFFFNYDGYRFNQGANPSYYNIPTEAERNGDFSALLSQGEIIYDPATTSCAPDGICTRQAFPGNIIPSDRISGASTYLQSFMPSTINNSVQNNYLGALTGGVAQNMYSANLDYQLTKSNHLASLTQHGSNPPIGLPPNGGPQLPLPYTSTRSAYTSITVQQLTDTDTITPNLVNTLGFQFNRFYSPFINPTRSGGYATKAGLSNLPVGEPQTEFPPVTFYGLNSPTLWSGYQFAYSWQETTNTFTTQNNIQWQKGKHSLTFGGQIQRFQDNVLFPSANYGYNFSNNETAGFQPDGSLNPSTGNSYASYLLGEVDSAGISDSIVGTTGMRYTDYALYLQDDWKVTPRLVVNAGLRYDIPKPGVEVHDYQSWLNPNIPNPAVGNYPGALQFAGNVNGGCNCGTIVQTHYNQVSPRVGFAYSFGAKSVIRGSYGIIRYKSGLLNGNAYFQGAGFLGYTASPSPASPNGGITPAFQWDSPFPSYTPPPFLDPTLNTGYNATAGPNGGSITYSRPDTAGRMPYTEDWNLTLERQVTPTVVFSLSYAGSRSLHGTTPGGYGIYSDQIDPKYLVLGSLLTATESPTTLAEAQAIVPGINVPYVGFAGSIGQMLRPFPQYSGVADPFALYSSSNYNSMQVYLKKNMSHGLLFLVSYTWSKELADSGMNMVPWVSSVIRSAYNLRQEYAEDGDNQPQVLSLSYVYQLPFGRGRALGHNVNSGLNTLIGGWQLSGIDFYNSGTALGPIGGACNTPYTNGCYASYNPNFTGPARINGSYGSGNPKAGTSYINVSAFQNAAPYTFGNTPRSASYGLHLPWYLNESLSLSKEFALPETTSLKLQADAFNLFNRTTFGCIGTSIVSANFGQVGCQANQPRQLQFEAYFRF
jgi:hypothetical protein